MCGGLPKAGVTVKASDDKGQRDQYERTPDQETLLPPFAES